MNCPTARSSILLTVFTVSVSACSSTAPIVVVPPASYEGIANRAASPTTISVLEGTVAAGPNSQFTNDLVTLSGSLNHTTGATSITDGGFTLTDADGPDGFNRLSDGTYIYSTPIYRVAGAGGAINDVQTFVVSNYRYVRPITGSHTTPPLPGGGAGGNVNLQGVYGVTTVAADVPTSGTANYTGESGGSYFDGSSTVSLVGSSNISVNFVAKTVNLVAGGLAMRGDLTGVPVLLQNFDEVRVTGMTISGNRFSGGTISFYNGGTHVLTSTLFGTSTKEIAGGNFFGYDPTISAPDEVGGVLSVEKTVGFGSADLIFVAD